MLLQKAILLTFLSNGTDHNIVEKLSSIIFVTSNFTKMLKSHSFLKIFVYFNMKLLNKSVIHATQA
jgi:hypothetical protein